MSEDPSKFPNQYREELLELLSESLANNKAGIIHWSKAYITYLPASAALLSHIGESS